MSKCRRLISIILLLLPIFLSDQAAVSAATRAVVDEKELDLLTSQILHKEIAFDEANLRFQLNTQSNRFKAWRYFASQEATAALIEGGLLAGVADRHRQIDHNGIIKGILLEHSLLPQMVGQCIGAAGDAAEIGFNARKSFLARKNSTDLGSEKRKALEMHLELLALLKQRNLLVAGFDADDRSQNKLLKLESSILEKQEKLLWWQSCKSLIDTKKISASQNCFYALDFLKNVSGASGSLVGIESIHLKEPRMNIGANVLTTISGVFIIANPFVSRIGGRLFAHSFLSDLDTSSRASLQSTIDSLKQDTNELRLTSQASSDQDVKLDEYSLARMSAYDQQFLRATRAVREDRARDRLSNRAALGQSGIAAAVGGSKVAIGVAGIIAADRLSATSGPPLILGGTIAYASGTALTLEENLRIILKREVRYRRDRKNNSRPQDILSRQLVELEKLDRELYKHEPVERVP